MLGWLDEAAVAFARVPFWALVAGHSLTAVELTSERLNAFWLISWLVGFLAAFGGGVATALLMMVRQGSWVQLSHGYAGAGAAGCIARRCPKRLSTHNTCMPRHALPQSPASASIALFARNEVWLAFTTVWWAYTYLPGARRLAALPPVRAAAKLARAVLRANQVVQRVNAAAALFPGVAAAPIVLGTLAGAGGKLLTDAFALCAGYGLPGERLAVDGRWLCSCRLPMGSLPPVCAANHC